MNFDFIFSSGIKQLSYLPNQLYLFFAMKLYIPSLINYGVKEPKNLKKLNLFNFLSK